MQIKANLLHKPPSLRASRCQVEKVVELSGLEFDRFLLDPQQDQPFIAENCELMHEWNGVDYCLLVLGEGRADGVLVEAEGYSWARYAAYVPEARTILSNRLDQAVDYIVHQATENTANGNWRVPLETLEAEQRLTIRSGSGLDELLKDALLRREEIAAAAISDGCVHLTCYLGFCPNLDKALGPCVHDLSQERKAAVFENAVSSICGLYEGEDLYTMLHGSFGLSIQEIRDCQYMTDEELTHACEVPVCLLEGQMRLRDALQTGGVSSRAVIGHRDSVFLIPLDALRELTDRDQGAYSAVLDARVADIQVDDGAPELLLDGVSHEEIDRLHDLLEAQKQTGPTAGPVM